MSKIEWTEQTWNPVTGCTEISAGCKNCYARGMHNRLRAMGQKKYQHDWHEVTCHPEELNKPLGWKKPRMVFVNSMSDLFHDDVPFEFIAEVLFLTMGEADPVGWHTRHTYQVLTKRPRRMVNFWPWLGGQIDHDEAWLDSMAMWGGPPKNLWQGFSASTQTDYEIGLMAFNHMAPGPGVRFVSFEPLLEPIELGPLFSAPHELGKPRQTIDWVIIGAESGPNQRPCNPEWVKSIVAQCDHTDTPVFVKQWHENGRMVKMPEVLGKVWNQYPR